MKNSELDDLACRRCGTCCLGGGPALHRADLPLFREEGGLTTAQVTAHRAGELMHDQPKRRVAPLEREILKVKSAPGSGACLFFDPRDKSCAAYVRRPLECRVLNCRDTAEIERVYETERLGRRDLIPAGHPLLELLDGHDAACSPAALAEACGRLLADDPAGVRDVSAMLSYDEEVRRQVTERAGLDPEDLDFLFGRPLTALLPGLGVLAVRRGGKLFLSKA